MSIHVMADDLAHKTVEFQDGSMISNTTVDLIFSKSAKYSLGSPHSLFHFFNILAFVTGWSPTDV